MLDKLVDNWKKAWKWYSMWGLVAIGAAPHAYEYVMAISGALTQHGVAVPAFLKWSITTLAAMTAVGRLVKQNEAPAIPATPPTP